MSQLLYTWDTCAIANSRQQWKIDLRGRYGLSAYALILCYTDRMNRALIMAAIVVVLGGGYALYRGLTRLPAVSQILPGIQVATAAEREKTDTYIIDAKYPQFGIPAIDAEIKERIGLSIDAFKKDAQEAGPPPADAFPYEFQSAFESVYVGEDVISAKIVASSYLGGAHPLAIVNALNFNRQSGRSLTLNDALAMVGLTLEDVAAEAKRQLGEKLGADLISPEGADSLPENYSTFFVSGDKVTFVFQPYQVAPYAAGAQEVSFTRVQ